MQAPAGPQRARFGIAGLDEVLAGGMPRQSVCLLAGPSGSGKTTFALQFALAGLSEGETCLFLSSAETPEQLRAVAASHGWTLEGIRLADWSEGAGSEDVAEYTLFPEAEVEVGVTLEHLFAEVEAARPARVVIDTVSALRMLAPSAAFYRRQLGRIRDVLAAHGCTTLLVDDAGGAEKDIRSQSLADSLVTLEHTALAYGGDRRRLRVQKLRGSRFVGGLHDFRIETGGVRVFPRLVAAAHDVLPRTETVPSGIPDLDAVTGGGLPGGSSTLVMGPAGSGKSTLAAAYVHAAAARGERSAVYLFDESPDSYLARSRGLALDLAPAVADGRVRLRPLDPAELSPGEIAHAIVGQVDREGVGLVVVDTVNGYLCSAVEEPRMLLHLRELLSYLTRRNVRTVMVLAEHGLMDAARMSPLDVSYLSDNVFLLRFFEDRGEIRRALAMVKKRTGRHERSIRELRTDDSGVSLSPPLAGYVRLLSGSPAPCAGAGSAEPAGG